MSDRSFPNITLTSQHSQCRPYDFVVLYLWHNKRDPLYFFFFTRGYDFIDLRDKGREREKHWLWELNLQPCICPDLESVSWYMGRCCHQLSHPARAGPTVHFIYPFHRYPFLLCFRNLSLLKCGKDRHGKEGNVPSTLRFLHMKSSQIDD